MRLRSLLALTGPALLMLPGCTSDLPAPTNFVPQEPLRPDNDLVVECAMLPVTANGARVELPAQTDPEVDARYKITGLLEDFTYIYTLEGEFPAGLTIDESTGELGGVIEADPATYTFDVRIEDETDPETYNATGTCTLQVNERLNAPLSIDAIPFCLRNDDSDTLLSLVRSGTGDGTPITCDTPGGNGNGRLPNGISVDPETCRIDGAIDEERRGTWVFMVRGTQSGSEVYVPYCVNNDIPQGYEITASHSGQDDADLIPIMRTYDPSAPFEVGVEGDPRFEITSPGICGASCFFRYSFVRTNAPLETFDLSPDGLVSNDKGESIGFFHELRVDGPAVPAEFRDRPWVLSVGVSYCMADDDGGCAEVPPQGDGALEFGLIMVPE